MVNDDPGRPDPDALLAQVQSARVKANRGRLKVYLGACPGVGKTFAMLSAAQRLRAKGTDVVVGLVETHGRSETAELLLGLELLPRRQVDYRGTTLTDFDLDAALSRQPSVLLLDELAHTNAPGSRHEKRWQDVQALLAARIDVFTTLNVQHLEGLNDVIARITGVQVRETVPDGVLEDADEVEVVDLAPDALLDRMRAGKVYVPEAARAAMESFFKKGNLAALRELSLRKTAQLVDRQRREDRAAGGARRIRSTSERVLVCVGPSPFSARLVRAAHRMAAVVRGELFAVNVAPPPGHRLTAEDRERVLQNLQIAERLGARIASIEGPDASSAMIGFARAHEISRIVIGRTRRSRLHELLFGSFTMDIIRRAGESDVYVIHDEDEADPAVRAESTPAAGTPTRVAWGDHLRAMLITAATVGIASLLYQPPDLSIEALVLILGIVVTTLHCGRWPAIVASVCSALAFNFLLLEPRFTFAVAEPAYLLAFTVMLVIGVTTGNLVARVRERAEAAREREAEITALHSFTRELADAETAEHIGRATVAHLRDLVPADLAVFVGSDDAAIEVAGLVASHGDTGWLGAGERAVARWCRDHNAPAGLGTRNLPGTRAMFVPLRSPRGMEGVLGVHPRNGEPPDARRRLLLDTFAEHASLAFERLALAEERRRANQEADIERLRSTLLSSVSHDLRTPLASITGAASSLLDDGSNDPASRRELLSGIANEAKRLNELIANLVFATRVDNQDLALTTQWTSVEEVIGAAVQRTADSLLQHVVEVDVPSGLPLVLADPVLLEQAVHLLLDNAAMHTPPGTRVRIGAAAHDAQLTIDVADDGPGIPVELRGRIFRRFERRPGSTGMGLGLPICAAILAAHGGSVTMPAADRGAWFRLSLPLPPAQPHVVEPTGADTGVPDA